MEIRQFFRHLPAMVGLHVARTMGNKFLVRPVAAQPTLFEKYPPFTRTQSVAKVVAFHYQ